MRAILILLVILIPTLAIAQAVAPVMPVAAVSLSIKEVAALVALIATIVGSTWKMSNVLNNLNVSITALRGIIDTNAVKLEALDIRLTKIENHKC